MRALVPALAGLLMSMPAIADEPALGGDPTHVTLMHYLESLIADLRRDEEAADKAATDRLDRIDRRNGESLAEHKVDDRAMSAAVQAVDARVSLIDGINAKVDSVSARVDRLAQMIAEVTGTLATASQAASTTAVRLEEAAKTLTARLETVQITVDRNSDRLTKLETGGSASAQETASAEAKLEARVTSIESSASGANWVWNALLAIGAFIAGVIGTWAMVRSARHETETPARRTR